MKALVTVILLGALLLAGCTTPVLLRHPDGRVAKCGPYPSGSQAVATALREAQCISDFQRQGFERVAGD